jgi:hypothetical protein
LVPKNEKGLTPRDRRSVARIVGLSSQKAIDDCDRSNVETDSTLTSAGVAQDVSERSAELCAALLVATSTSLSGRETCPWSGLKYSAWRAAMLLSTFRSSHLAGPFGACHGFGSATEERSAVGGRGDAWSSNPSAWRGLDRNAAVSGEEKLVRGTLDAC